MRAMKDSGVEWIGEIPSTWKRIPLKRWLAFREGGAWGEEAAGDENDVVCIRVADFDYPKLAIKSVGEFTFRHYDAGVIDKLALVDGDILVEKSGGGEKTPVGRAVMYQGSTKALFANFMDRLRIPPSLSARYFLYVWTAFYQSGHVSPYIKQTTGIQNLDLTAMLSIVSAPNPDLNEQKRIASFLDAKCAQIDAIIEKQQLVIEKLKAYKQSVITEAVTKGLDPTVPMKDSGVEWIGKIPETWRIGTVHYGARKIGSGKTPKGGAEVYSDSGVLFLRSQNVYETGLQLDNATYISEEIDEEMATTRVYPGDVLLNITGGSIGRSCVFPEGIGHANVNQHVCIIRVDPELFLPKYMNYFWVSDAGQNSIDIFQSGANREGMNFEQIGKTRIPYLPLEEQKQIVSYLDRCCFLIENAISKKRAIINKLTDYKKSLIYEAVTGKMEV